MSALLKIRFSNWKKSLNYILGDQKFCYSVNIKSVIKSEVLRLRESKFGAIEGAVTDGSLLFLLPCPPPLSSARERVLHLAEGLIPRPDLSDRSHSFGVVCAVSDIDKTGGWCTDEARYWRSASAIAVVFALIAVIHAPSVPPFKCPLEQKTFLNCSTEMVNILGSEKRCWIVKFPFPQNDYSGEFSLRAETKNIDETICNRSSR